MKHVSRRLSWNREFLFTIIRVLKANPKIEFFCIVIGDLWRRVQNRNYWRCTFGSGAVWYFIGSERAKGLFVFWIPKMHSGHKKWTFRSSFLDLKNWSSEKKFKSRWKLCVRARARNELHLVLVEKKISNLTKAF